MPAKKAETTARKTALAEVADFCEEKGIIMFTDPVSPKMVSDGSVFIPRAKVDARYRS